MAADEMGQGTLSTSTFPPLVLFDLDGTLLDSAPDFVATLRVLRSRHGLPPISEAALRPHVKLQLTTELQNKLLHRLAETWVDCNYRYLHSVLRAPSIQLHDAERRVTPARDHRSTA